MQGPHVRRLQKLRGACCAQTTAAAIPVAEEGNGDGELSRNKWLFEVNGFVVVHNVLDTAEVQELNELIDAQGVVGGADWVGSSRFGQNPGSYEEMMGLSAAAISSDYTIPATAVAASPPAVSSRGEAQASGAGAGFLAWGAPFCRLLDHEALMPYLAFTMDATGEHLYAGLSTGRSVGIRLDRLYGIQQTAGPIHSGGLHCDFEGTYQFSRGQMRNSLVVAAWALTDSGGLERGGFCCYPGSHKANLPMPPSFNREFNGGERGVPPGLVCPMVPAGSLLLFSEALIHGTLAWRDHSATHAKPYRRTLLYKYAQKHVTQGRDAVPPQPSAQTLTKRQQLLFAPSQAGRSHTFHPLE